MAEEIVSELEKLDLIKLTECPKGMSREEMLWDILEGVIELEIYKLIDNVSKTRRSLLPGAYASSEDTEHTPVSL
jgi:hypothetical protein